VDTPPGAPLAPPADALPGGPGGGGLGPPPPWPAGDGFGALPRVCAGAFSSTRRVTLASSGWGTDGSVRALSAAGAPLARIAAMPVGSGPGALVRARPDGSGAALCEPPSVGGPDEKFVVANAARVGADEAAAGAVVALGCTPAGAGAGVAALDAVGSTAGVDVDAEPEPVVVDVWLAGAGAGSVLVVPGSLVAGVVVVVGAESFLVVSAGGVCWAGGDCEDEESLDDEPVDDEPVDEPPVDDPPVDDEPLDEPPVDDEPVEDDSLDDEPVDDGSDAGGVWVVSVADDDVSVADEDVSVTDDDVSVADDDVSAAVVEVSAAVVVSAAWEVVPASDATTCSAAPAEAASTAVRRHAKSTATVTRHTRCSPQLRLIASPSGKGDRPPKVVFPERDAATSIGRRETRVHRRTDLFPVQRSTLGAPRTQAGLWKSPTSRRDARPTTRALRATRLGGSMQLHGCA
jgi:hypothetical protein